MSVSTNIFDCDGVLVDSEAIGAEVFRSQASECGVCLSSAANTHSLPPH